MSLMHKPSFLPPVSIIISVVGYQQLPKYLVDSLRLLDYPKSKLSLVLIKNELQGIKLLRIGVRVDYINIRGSVGYGQAANLGVKISKGNYILLINPDIKLDKMLLKRMMNYLLNFPRVGVVGPKIMSLTSPEKISRQDLPGINFNFRWGKFAPVKPSTIDHLKDAKIVDWVSGCVMLFSKLTWQTNGGFDERYFLYFEDADFCWRLKQRGLKTVILPQAKAYHQGSMSLGEINPLRIYYLTKSSRLFLAGHSGLPGQIRFS